MIHLSLGGISQTSNDSTLISIPTYQLKKAINLIEKGKVTEEELSITKDKVLILNESLKKKDGIIAEYSKKDSLILNTLNSYKSIIDNLESSLANEKKINVINKIKNRRQKLKKWYSLFIGIGIGFLIHK